jgi:hypothetical protein
MFMLANIIFNTEFIDLIKITLIATAALAVISFIVGITTFTTKYFGNS